MFQNSFRPVLNAATKWIVPNGTIAGKMLLSARLADGSFDFDTVMDFSKVDFNKSTLALNAQGKGNQQNAIPQSKNYNPS